ncbi:MAG: bacteriohemerythrin, partial [Rhodospirillales bacterium]|nr:bacteriohemerythrin [Rhodospirillales bacterium]
VEGQVCAAVGLETGEAVRRVGMARFEWAAEYDTGNDNIDDQHKQIFDAANLLFEAVRQKKEGDVLDQLFDVLLQYTNTHFKDEEEFFEEIGSSLLTFHKAEHRRLVDEIRDMWREKRQGSSEDIGMDLEHWMEQRLVPHIIKEDVRALEAAS